MDVLGAQSLRRTTRHATPRRAGRTTQQRTFGQASLSVSGTTSVATANPVWAQVAPHTRACTRCATTHRAFALAVCQVPRRAPEPVRGHRWCTLSWYRHTADQCTERVALSSEKLHVTWFAPPSHPYRAIRDAIPTSIPNAIPDDRYRQIPRGISSRLRLATPASPFLPTSEAVWHQITATLSGDVFHTPRAVTSDVERRGKLLSACGVSRRDVCVSSL